MFTKTKASRSPRKTKKTTKRKSTRTGMGRTAPTTGNTLDVCMRTNADGSTTTVSVINGGACPLGFTKIPKTTTVAALNGIARKKKVGPRGKVKRACRTLVKSEGVKANGQLKKGYKYKKGGGVVKAGKTASRKK